ncbi:UNVERIFIED_CONTAM: hypothetical protein FKN15_031196 [Acipenser sinensis]
MGQQLSEDKEAEIGVAELQEWYKKFVVECPSGTLFMHEFKGFFGVTDNQEAAEYIENMFRAFDKNGDNTIDFLEYVAALNLVLRGKLEHKLKWTFKMYDKDGNGCIDKTELLEIVEAIYRLKKACHGETGDACLLLTPDQVVDRIFQLVDANGDGQDLGGDGGGEGRIQVEMVEAIYRLKKACHGETGDACLLLTPDQVVDRIFQLVDANGDGQLSLDEFIDGAQRDKWVMKMLQMDVNPGGWISEQRRKSTLF